MLFGTCSPDLFFQSNYFLHLFAIEIDIFIDHKRIPFMCVCACGFVCVKLQVAIACTKRKRQFKRWPNGASISKTNIQTITQRRPVFQRSAAGMYRSIADFGQVVESITVAIQLAAAHAASHFLPPCTVEIRKASEKSAVQRTKPIKWSIRIRRCFGFGTDADSVPIQWRRGTKAKWKHTAHGVANENDMQSQLASDSTTPNSTTMEVKCIGQIEKISSEICARNFTHRHSHSALRAKQ